METAQWERLAEAIGLILRTASQERVLEDPRRPGGLPHYTACFTLFANLCRNFWTFGATTYEQYGCRGLLAKYS